jgi:LmbE family N-acetylglucosaminyl deacetylase
MLAIALLPPCTAAGAGPAKPARVKSLALPRHPRVLVFSPHPDDETLAAGGLIHRLVQEGAAVKVAFLTNGDGWPWAARTDFHVTKPTDADYLAMGELRQREALAAARRLGLRKRDVAFLGFPDGGLAELWRAHWLRSHPYTSPYTREDSPPYDDSLNPDVDYDGQDLTSVLSRLLRTFQPNVVVVPHPYDAHLDHAHTGYFVIEAIDAVQARHELPRDVTILTYLVHSDVWPPAPGAAPDRLAPPPSSVIPDTAWLEIKLSANELAAKEDALARYRSQVGLPSDLLQRFIRRNELFGRISQGVLTQIASIH